MKLDDIKAIVDAYFDKITEKNLFDLLTSKYSMPVIYDIELPHFNYDINHSKLSVIGDIQYRNCEIENHVDKNGKNDSTNICVLTMNIDESSTSYSISLAS